MTKARSTIIFILISIGVLSAQIVISPNPSSSGSATNPGGNNTEVQFNDSNAFGGDADLTWNKTTNRLTITGSIASSEISAPSAPAANSGIIFLQDDGSGKTQACVRFATGDPQCFATEP